MVNSLTLKKRNATSTRVSSTQMMLIAGKAQQEKIADLRSQVSITQMTLFVGVSFSQSLTFFKAKFYEKEKETCYMGYRKNGGPYGAATVYE